MVHRFDVHTQYRTIYLSSDSIKESLKPEAISMIIDKENSRLVAVKNTLIITTGTYGHIRGEVKFLDKRKDNIDYRQYEHIVEAGLDIYSGKLQISDCPNSHIQFELHVKPGVYGVRVYSSGISTSDFDEQEGRSLPN